MYWSPKQNRTVSLVNEGEDEKDEEICPLCNCLNNVSVSHETPSGRDAGINFENCNMNKSRVQAAYFHKACHKCPDISQDSLCVVCKHTRLRHLIHCLLLADSLTHKEVLNRSNPYPCSLDNITLNLGCALALEERSGYCDTCRIFSGAAKEVMGQTNLSPDLECYISVNKSAVTFGGVKCSFAIYLYLKPSQQNLKLNAPSQRLRCAYTLGYHRAFTSHRPVSDD